MRRFPDLVILSLIIITTTACQKASTTRSVEVLNPAAGQPSTQQPLSETGSGVAQPQDLAPSTPAQAPLSDWASEVSRAEVALTKACAAGEEELRQNTFKGEFSGTIQAMTELLGTLKKGHEAEISTLIGKMQDIRVQARKDGTMKKTDRYDSLPGYASILGQLGTLLTQNAKTTEYKEKVNLLLGRGVRILSSNLDIGESPEKDINQGPWVSHPRLRIVAAKASISYYFSNERLVLDFIDGNPLDEENPERDVPFMEKIRLKLPVVCRKTLPSVKFKDSEASSSLIGM